MDLMLRGGPGTVPLAVDFERKTAFLQNGKSSFGG
jgi:hypothetical protein